MDTEKQKSSQVTQIPFPKCIGHEIFLDLQLQPLSGCWILLNQSLILRKQYAQITSGCSTKYTKTNTFYQF